MPTISNSRGKKTYNNPFLAWLDGRKERRRQAEEEAAKLITNETAKNENIIIAKLESIDFLHSKLPMEELTKKTDPNQKVCDLEYAVLGVIHQLKKNPQLIKMDIRKFDRKVLTVVLLLKQAVELGDVRAALAAKGALIRAIVDIRGRIPQNQPELSKQFVEKNSQYMDQWITLISMSQVADRQKQNVDSQKTQNDLKQKDHDKKVEAFEEEIRKDPVLAKAFKELTNRETVADKTKWSETERELYSRMLQHSMDKVVMKLNKILLTQEEADLAITVGQVEIMYAQVAKLQIIADPNLMNKFQESIDQLFQQLYESDARIDETLRAMDDIEGRLQQLNNAPGALRAKQVTIEAAADLAEEIRLKQEQEIAAEKINHNEFLKKLGIRTKEELEMEKLEAQQRELQKELEMRRQLEEQVQQIEELNEELNEQANQELITN